jgi:photosystem II stability/assembly factor-like uncharacterized protein
MDTNNIFVVGDSGYILRRSFADETFIMDTNLLSPVIGKSISFNDVAYYDRYVIAVGSDGTIKRSIDTGWTWTTPTSQTVEHLHQIKFASDFSSSGIAWIVGDGGAFLRSTNFGSTWVRLDSGIRQTVFAASKSPAGVLYVTSTGGIVFRSINNGMTWRRDSLSNIGARLMDVAFDSNGFGLLSTYDSKVLRTLDSGSTWAPQNVGTASTLILGVAVQGNIGLACGANGQMFRTINKGGAWASVTSGTNRTLYDVELFGTNAIAVGDNGATIHSTNQGQSWTSVTQGTTRFNRVRFANSSEAAVAVAQSGTIARTTDHGQHWSNVTPASNENLSDVQFHDDRNGIAVGDRGTILKTTNMGAAWTTDVSHTINDLKGAIILSGTDAFVAGSRTTILFTSNSALPVELVSFKGRRVTSGEVLIDWQVAREENNRGFAVDRMHDHRWHEIAFIRSAGATQTGRSYHLTDAQAPAAATSYRLRQIDLDGTQTILGQLEVGHVQVEGQNISLWPNPTSELANLRFALDATQQIRIVVLNAVGVEVDLIADRVFGPGTHTLEIRTGHLMRGHYQIRLTHGDREAVETLIVD